MKYSKDELNAMIDDKTNYYWFLFYFNKKDPRFILPKRSRIMGWQLNYSNKRSIFVIVLIIVFVVLISKIF